MKYILSTMSRHIPWQRRTRTSPYPQQHIKFKMLCYVPMVKQTELVCAACPLTARLPFHVPDVLTFTWFPILGSIAAAFILQLPLHLTFFTNSSLKRINCIDSISTVELEDLIDTQICASNTTAEVVMSKIVKLKVRLVVMYANGMLNPEPRGLFKAM